MDSLRAAVAVRGKREEFLVVWTRVPSSSELGEGSAILARRVDARGTLLSEPFVIAAGPVWTRVDGATFAYGGDRREFMVLWDGPFGSRDAEVYGARVAAGGDSASEAFRVSRTPAGKRGLPRAYGATIAYDARHRRYLAAWQARRGSSFVYEVFTRTLPGQPDRPLGRVRRISGFQVPNGHTPRPKLAHNRAEGEYAVVWTAGEHEEREVYARRIGPDGRPRGPETLVHNGSAFGASDPDIAVTDAGRYVVVYEQWGSSERSEFVKARRLGRRLRPGRALYVSSASPAADAAISSARGAGPRAAWAQEDPSAPSSDETAYEVFARGL